MSNAYLNFIDCETPMNSSLYMDMAPCSKTSSLAFSLSSNQTYSYVVVGSMYLSGLENSCMIYLVVSASTRGQKIDNNDWLLYGTDLQWSSECPPCGEILVFQNHSVYFYLNTSNRK